MKRLSIYPIENPDLWERYKKAELTTRGWGAEGGDYSKDEWNSLSPNQQQHLGLNLAFFANADKIVSDNLAINFLTEDLVPEEAKFFYAQQLFNENIHNVVYGDIIINYFPKLEEQMKMLQAVENFKAVEVKIAWADKWITNGNFYEKLVAFSAVEAILFSSTFSTIFSYKAMNKNLPGLYWANTEISRDETSHYEFAQYLYNTRFKNALSDETLIKILIEASEAEQQFVRDCFVFKPEGFREEDMLNYVKYVTDTVLINFNLPVYYNVKPNIINEYMKGIATPARTNFFENKSAEYSVLKDTEFKMTNDF